MRLIDSTSLILESDGESVPLHAIVNAPTIEAEPVRHGRWKSVGLSSLKCSRCGYIDDYKMHYKGCPECRAKMDGGANE